MHQLLVATLVLAVASGGAAARPVAPEHSAAPEHPVAPEHIAPPVTVEWTVDEQSAQRPGEPNEASQGEWVWPVEAAVLDYFRAPSTPWGPGNRGWEFSTVRGDVVFAVGSGTAVWAGWVAGKGVVTIDHGAGLVSSVTGLIVIEVAVGDSVAVGSRIGLSAPRLHLGFRRSGVYVDPAEFLTRPLHAVLVPVPDDPS